ncbi:MAG: adenine phosphoribosyltransferase [Planctomycetes bacterium]|nr:adenine phosphoribosyltransferase [Planctomycetota bacterium]
MESDVLDLTKVIRDVPDFPKKGILFKDITPILASPAAFGEVIRTVAGWAKELGAEAVAGIESRGFIVGAPVAAQLGLPFVPARKKGKLPYKTRSVAYALEYGQDAIEMHEDAFAKGRRVAVVDDLLATGGTMSACCRLVEDLGAQVAGCLFIVELGFLKGREKLAKHPVRAMVNYAGE